MINKFEISRKAKELGLQASTIEKDYVLGWMLIGIQNHPQTRDSWVFKGGTCLKKCFFNRYRFSEDLDFTLLDSLQMKEEALKPILKEIAQWVYEQSGIEIPENLISFAGYFRVDLSLKIIDLHQTIFRIQVYLKKFVFQKWVAVHSGKCVHNLYDNSV